MKYTVGITGRIYVIATFEVDADTAHEAENMALQMAREAGGRRWNHYTTTPDSDSLQIENTTKHD